MLNVGPLELLVVLAVALVVVGPERLPELARSVGRALRQLRDVQDEVRGMVSMGVDDEVRQAASEIKKASGNIKRATDVKGAVKRVHQDVRADVETPSPRTRRPAGPQPEEAGGPPADRLTGDGAAEAGPPVEPPSEGAPPPADRDGP